MSSCHAAESVAIIKKAHNCATDVWLLVWSEIAAWNGIDATADAQTSAVAQIIHNSGTWQQRTKYSSNNQSRAACVSVASVAVVVGRNLHKFRFACMMSAVWCAAPSVCFTVCVLR